MSSGFKRTAQIIKVWSNIVLIKLTNWLIHNLFIHNGRKRNSQNTSSGKAHWAGRNKSWKAKVQTVTWAWYLQYIEQIWHYEHTTNRFRAIISVNQTNARGKSLRCNTKRQRNTIRGESEKIRKRQNDEQKRTKLSKKYYYCIVIIIIIIIVVVVVFVCTKGLLSHTLMFKNSNNWYFVSF
jgi:hypothetical protein